MIETTNVYVGGLALKIQINECRRAMALHQIFLYYYQLRRSRK